MQILGQLEGNIVNLVIPSTRQKLHMRLWKDSTSPIINFEQIGAAHFTGGLDVKTIRTLQVTLQTHLAGVRTPWAPYQIFSARFCAPFR